MNLSLFKQVAIDSIHSPFGTFEWHTWSDELRKCFIDLKQNLIFKNLKPSLIYVSGFNQYNYTYQIPDEIIEEIDPERRLDLFVKLLNEVDPGEDLWFFTNLIDCEIDAKALHVFFSIFRSRISSLQENEMAALYAPLTVANKGFFPLHCDLYIPRTLFNVYEDVSLDQSGASIFLSAKKLVSEILPGMKEMPKDIQSKIADLLHHNDYADKYEEFYALLHSRLNPWYHELKEKLEAEQFSWKFERGQGYLLHDRKWLHGRTKPNGGLTQKRVHRLVFS